MKIEEKYPEAYLEHFIAMYDGELTRASFREHAALAMSMEGKEYLVGLVEEIVLIEKNKDEKHFVNYAKEMEQIQFSENHIKEMKAEIILLLNS